MSKSVERASTRVLEEHQKNSVYDILYCDTRRIGSFLSQFDDSGHLEKITQKDILSTGTKRGVSLNVGGGATLAGTGGSGTIGMSLTPSIGGSEGSERTYDPLWANALAFLDYLTERNLIQREVTKARIGHFLLIQGSLSIMDLSLFKGMWQLPEIRKSILSSASLDESRNSKSSSIQPRKNKPDAKKSQLEINIDSGMALINMLPHSIQARIYNSSNDVFWTSLKEESLVVSGADLTMKHGTSVPGSWAMLGILDAYPDVDNLGNITEDGAESLARSILLSDGAFGAMMAQMLPHIRPMLGRPSKAYGITPLLVFREILS